MQLKYGKFDTSIPLWATKPSEPLERPQYWRYYPHSATASPAFKELFVWMTQRDPKSRPTVEQIRSHKFMEGECATEEEVITEQTRRLTIFRAQQAKKLAEKAQAKEALRNWR